MDGMDNGMDADADAASRRRWADRSDACDRCAGGRRCRWGCLEEKKKKIAEEKALEGELEEELDNELGEPEMTTADVSEDETKDVEKNKTII